MHDMKLEVDQLVYTPKRHKIHDGRLPPEEAAAGAAAEPPPDPSELFKAAAEIAGGCARFSVNIVVSVLAFDTALSCPRLLRRLQVGVLALL